MNSVNAEFIERYQLLYQKDPNSKVFAPLGEAYRKLGLLDEAYRICELGVQKHPNFPSGRVAFAKVLIEKKMFEDALEQLKRAVEISPENILAHSLMGESYLHLREMKESLKSFKMVLFLNPNDQRALNTVKKLESLTADEYDKDVFEVRPAEEVVKSSKAKEFNEATFDTGRFSSSRSLDSLTQQRVLERNLSLVDAYIVRNDIESAMLTLDRATDQIGKHPELEKRRKILVARQNATLTTMPTVVPEPLRYEEKIRRKISKLNQLVERIQSRKHSPAF